MEQYEVPSARKDLRNWSVPVPGSTVTAYLAQWASRPGEWGYSLWTSEGDAETLLVSGCLPGIPAEVTAEQVANIAFMLEVDYA